MPQADGRDRLKRMEFVLNGRSYTFSVNPEEYTQEEPSRSVVTQTKGGAWVDDFGAGLQTINIQGTTGFRNGLGVTKFKELRNMIRNYYGGTAELTFHNWTDDESWIVHTDPSGFRLMRSKSNPLLYMYEIRLVCLRSASHPATVSTTLVAKSLGSAIPDAPSDATTAIEAVTPFIEKQVNKNASTPEPIVATELIKALRVATDGKVQGASEVLAEDTTSYSFVPQVSPLAVAALEQYQTTASLQNLFATEGTLTEQLMNLETKKLPPNLLVAFRLILLEILAIWQQIGTDPSMLPKSISEDDLERLATNIHWLAEELFKRSDVDYGVTNNLRWLSRAVQTILSSGIYSKQLKQEVGELNDVLR